MGATKRLAEWLVADAAARTGRPYVAVRFGNVLGSAGSVLPIFQSQLENGEAITVTHPEMSRYFMTIQEAGWLILDAAAIGRPGDLFVLDMGEPVKIIDMVHDLIRLAGRDVESVPIRFTGLRPGEKLHERLFYETENVALTDVDKIFRVVDARSARGCRGACPPAAGPGLRRSRRRAADRAVRLGRAPRSPTGQAAAASADVERPARDRRR